ncbi:MAG: hypothetical protein HY741_20050 [Chloroflexi bacterium]|nr:hypothetical protein [Chloroflexota bacterium]
MIATMVKVKADENGNVEIPSSLWRELGIEPNQEVEVMVTPLKVNKPATPVKLTDEDRARLKRIGELIEETFAGMDWEYVREGRRDRWL